MATDEPTTTGKRRKRRRKASLAGWINAVYDERPDLLAASENDEIVALYKKQYPHRTGEKEIKRLRQNVNNVKSQRKRDAGKGRRPGRPPGQSVVRASKGAGATIQRLEERIDDVLAMARGLDADGLGEVVQTLRSARNAVVRMGSGR
jgi:hypothetical protein